MRASFVGLVLLLAGTPALAQSEPPTQTQSAAPAELEAQIRFIEAALARIHAEQQSIYQQFQMVKAIRRNERQELQNPPQAYVPPMSIRSYDDVVRDRQARGYRLYYYTSQLDQLYGRHRELEEQKRPLLEQLAGLVAQRRPVRLLS